MDAKEDSPILPPGSPVRLIDSGRIGKIVDHDPNDTVLPYMVRFDDNGSPEQDWYRKDAIAVEVAAAPTESKMEEQNEMAAPAEKDWLDELDELDPVVLDEEPPPAAAVEEPSPCTETPSAAAVVEETSPFTEKPSTAALVEEPPPCTEKPSAAAVVEEPSPCTEEPPATAVPEEMPSSAAESSPAAIAEEESQATAHAPSSEEEQQASTGATAAADPEEAAAAENEVTIAAAGNRVADGPEKPAAASEATHVSGGAMARAQDNLGIYREALERLSEQLGEVPVIKTVADRCRMPPLAVAIVGASSIASFCLWGFCGQLISILLGVMLPAFESFKAVEAFSNISDPTVIYGKASSMQFWLIYWVVVAVFSSCEYMFYFVLKWIPFYYPVKLVVLLWLYLPQTRGANHVYHWLVAPTFRKNRHHIDAAIEQSSKHIKRGVSGAVTNIAVTSLGAGAGGVAHLSRTVSQVVPELGGVLLKKLVSRGNLQTFNENDPKAECKSE